jgi:glyoxylase-like metal-dependent hydrolase (beta-lactamase superfamily II)
MINIHKFTFNPFEENTYLLVDENKEAIIVDPGNSNSTEDQKLIDFIEGNHLKVVKIINTHCHIDHVLGVENLKNHFHIPFEIPREEKEVFHAVKTYAAPYGFPQFKESTVDELVDHTDSLKLGTDEFEILHVPGHSPGHVVFYHPQQRFIIGGDVLFYGSIGRTDLPGGNHEQLIRNIKQKLFSLPDEVKVYCGHGPETTLGFEKKNNPFLT